MKRAITPCILTLFTLIGIKTNAQLSEAKWVDSVYNSLTLEQRIAQLLVVRVWAWKDSIYNDSIVRVVNGNHAGGICIFRGSPVKQVHLTNRLQQTARTPLLVTTDAEWGLGMRLDSAFSFPRQMALGAIGNDSLIYEMGRLVAKGCRRMGIQANFAPVADVNNNPDNPVIGFRSFGENPALVAAKSSLYMKGMQREGIMTSAKHFPGHGDTGSDSHLTLPVISQTRERLDSVELLPFRRLIRDGVDGVMIAHLYVPCLDSAGNTPTTLSEKVVTGLLKDQLGFRGYVITDALDMQGVTKFYKPGEIEVKALLAGNDILLLPQHVDIAIQGIKTAVDSGIIPDSLLAYKCRRILSLKYRLGLNHPEPVSDINLVADLNPPAAEMVASKMVKASLTLVKNDLMMVPLTGLDRRRVAVLSLGDSVTTVFQSTLARYMPMEMYNLPRRFSAHCADSLFTLISKNDIVIIGLHGITSTVADSFGITGDMRRFYDTLVNGNRVLVTLFGTPYALNRLPRPSKPEAILVAYQDNAATERSSAEALFGGIAVDGKLPVTASIFGVGSHDVIEKTRIETVLPEEIGIPRASLSIIDSMAVEGIRKGAYPGCQVLLAKNGKIFYEKSFGTHRYKDSTAVTPSDIYDLASVTKIAATTLAVMKLYDDGKINLSDTLGIFLPMVRGSNKGPLRIKDIMTHQAGLMDWIPLYKSTLKDGEPDPTIYSATRSDVYPVRVAENLFIRKGFSENLFRAIIDSPLRPAAGYKYSDLGFYLLRLVVEQISGKPFETYLSETFYKPLGLTTLGFNPRERFDLARIIPTENDREFRHQLVWGDVHDPGAAMLGGISGHAGLFSNAFDVAVILQMLLAEGSYGGKQYIHSQTVNEFTRVQFPEKGNRRGLGFDKPPILPVADGPSCASASPESFGHSGFTGTYIWADPANGLLYVFLSNRVCPDASNQKLAEMNIRTRIHQAAYDILQRYQIK
jgi:beta-glucosidase-like glycosyl hydrolase/CubicO group peptidase (beta-lactamase class C family)